MLSYVTLALLGIGRDAVSDDLVGAGAGNAFDAKGEGNMFDGERWCISISFSIK